MAINIALAGNPNCGKTTMFNDLTGANQYVGNWPGVTVEKKEGRYRADKGVVVTDLPGVYSLSPYTPEEIVTLSLIHIFHDEVSCLLGNDGHLRSLDKPEVLEMMVHIALSPHADNLSGIAATQERQRHRLARRARAAGPADGALHNHRIAHDDSNQC